MLFFCMTSTIQSEYPAPDAVLLDSLIGSTASGDMEAFARLYHSTERAVYGFILSILRNRNDAEDILQDTYLNICTHAGSYQPQGKPMAWILTIAKNLARMRLREQRRTATAETPELEPDQTVPAQDENRVVLDTALRILSEEERQIVLLHASAGLKHRETAALLGLPLSTVLSKYRRALGKLKRQLQQGGIQL